MTAKQYLRQIRIIDGRIRRNTERIRALRASADGVRGITYDADKVQSSPVDSMAAIVGQIVDLERETAEQIAGLEKLRSEIVRQIHTIDYDEGEEVLYQRWVECRNFYDIAEDMNYSLRQVHNIHGRALQLLTERLHTIAQS